MNDDDEYMLNSRVGDNRRHCKTINEYWAARGINANARVSIRTGEIVSDLKPQMWLRRPS